MTFTPQEKGYSSTENQKMRITFISGFVLKNWLSAYLTYETISYAYPDAYVPNRTVSFPSKFSILQVPMRKWKGPSIAIYLVKLAIKVVLNRGGNLQFSKMKIYRIKCVLGRKDENELSA